MKRAGFTMIELIFVIVILGILAAVAVPKLAATRDDAKIAAEITAVSQVIQNLGAAYTAKGILANVATKCVTVAAAGQALIDGNVTISLVASTVTDCGTPAFIVKVGERLTNNNSLSALAATKYHTFGGTGVVY